MSSSAGKTDDAKMRKKLSASKSIEKPGAEAKIAAKKRGLSLADAAPAEKSPPSPGAGNGGRTVSAHPSGNAMRDKVRQLLADALYVESDALGIGKDVAVATAVDIECAMFSELGGVGSEYKMKARELKFNLGDAKNKDLRAEVLEGALAPATLVKMTSKDLANSEMKAERQKLHQHFLREAAAGNTQTATTDEFRCGKCKKRECTYYELQTRGADEPLTVFVSCTNCQNRWRF
jgi:transcription elongation factor S-II